MKFRFIVIIFLFFLSSNILHCQKRYLFRYYNTSNGLINNIAYSINQDKRGYIYIGTEAGISRFDGNKFVNDIIPVISQNLVAVRRIEKDRDGNLITISANQGIFVQQADGFFNQYLLDKPGIAANGVNALKIISNNKALVTKRKTLFMFENGNFKKIYKSNNGFSFYTLEYDKKGNIWFGGFSGLGVILAGDSTYTPYFFPEIKEKSIIKIILDKQGCLWIGSTKGLYKLNYKPDVVKRTYKLSQPVKRLTNTYINHIYLDKTDNLWVSSSTSGTFKIKGDSVIDNITQDNGLPAVGVMSVFQDNENNYWFATVNGVAKLADFNKYSFTFEGNLLKNAYSIQSDSFGRLYLSNNKNIFTIKNNIVKKYDFSKSIINPNESKYYKIENKTFWVLNSSGLYSMPIDTGELNLSKLKMRADFNHREFGKRRCMNIHKDGNIWISFENGVFVFHNNTFTPCRFNCENSSEIIPQEFKIDKFGYYWIVNYYGGLYRMKLSKLTKSEAIFDSIKVYQCSKPDSSFVTVSIEDIMFDYKGNLWMSVDNIGCYKLRIDKNGVADWKLLSNKDGLSSNLVTGMVEDDKHNIWFLSIKGADYYNTATGKFIYYNKKNGLGDQVYNAISANKHLYIEFDEGIMAIDDFSKENRQVIIPNVLITDVMVNGTADTLAFCYNGPRKYKYNQNSLTFYFNSISFKYDDVNKFQYSLEGLNKIWSPFSESQNINFSNLAPGRYCFKVRAKNPDGVESKDIATFPFIIVPPFYRTWWFILLFTTLIIAVLYAAYRYRIRQLLKVERLRTRIASDLHDDVGSTLSSISILSEILNSQLDNSAKSSEMIAKIGSNARNMLESMDDIIWAVNPSNDKFQNLELRIREYAIPLFESKDIQFRIDSDETLNMVQLPMDVRRNIYLIAKEATNNLVKYAECTEANIRFQGSNNNLVITVSDNGKGFDPESPTSRNGLKNMKRRASQINAHLEIVSVPEKGSTVKLTVKII